MGVGGDAGPHSGAARWRAGTCALGRTRRRTDRCRRIYDPLVDEDEWLDPAEAARLLKLPERIIYVLIAEGTVPAVRWPARIRRADLDLVLEACRIRPGDLAHLNAYSGGRYRYKK